MEFARLLCSRWKREYAGIVIRRCQLDLEMKIGYTTLHRWRHGHCLPRYVAQVAILERVCGFAAGELQATLYRGKVAE